MPSLLVVDDTPIIRSTIVNVVARSEMGFSPVVRPACLNSGDVLTLGSFEYRVFWEIDALDAENMGYMIYFFEKVCAVSGYMQGVNPFNQPGVESYKKNMFALLGKPGYESEKENLEKALELDTSKYQVALVLPFGYRINPQSPQLRLPFEEVVAFID